MMKIAILGYGNIGRAAEQAIKAAPDMELAGVYHHNDNLDTIQADVVLLCTPTREVEGFAQKLLAKGICTVDSFDIHQQIYDINENREHLTCDIDGAVVKGTVVKNGKGKKIYVLKYKSKKDSKKKIGHRQPYTKVQITSIVG